jgi:hypothetical protein
VSKLVLFLFEMFSDFPCGRLYVHRTITRVSEKAYSIYNGYPYLRIPSFRYCGFYRATFRCSPKFVSERQVPPPPFFQVVKYVISLDVYEHTDFPAMGGNICRNRTGISQPLTGRNRERRLCRLVIIWSGMRLRRTRNGYVKKSW